MNKPGIKQSKHALWAATAGVGVILAVSGCTSSTDTASAPTASASTVAGPWPPRWVTDMAQQDMRNLNYWCGLYPQSLDEVVDGLNSSGMVKDLGYQRVTVAEMDGLLKVTCRPAGSSLDRDAPLA